MDYTTLTLAANEIAAMRPAVYIDGQLRTDVYCDSILERVDGQPGEATMSQHPSVDEAGPITLRQHNQRIDFGSRVKVMVGDAEILFLGHIVRREDQGKSDSIRWVAYDDLWLLSLIPVRGALVYDPDLSGTTKVKFLSRYTPHCNPGGFWNCVGAPVANIPGGTVWPVFAPVADFGKTYEMPDEQFGEITEGRLTPWTPRLFLKYLCLLANLPSSAVAGIHTNHWRSLYGSADCRWRVDSIDGMRGAIALGDYVDPLDRKLPDIDFRGTRMLRAITRALDCAGTHSLRVTPYMDSAGSINSRVEFVSKGWSALLTADPLPINLKRGGTMDTVDTAVDFSLAEDVTETAEAVLVEGDVTRVETRLEYDPDDDETSLRPAWTEEEEQAFLAVIQSKEDSDYALVPQDIGEEISDWQSPPDDWEDADGSDGRPYAEKRSPEAVALARQFYPTVFRAFVVDSKYMTTALAGAESEFTSTALYPRLRHNRPILPEQLQFMLRQVNAAEAEANRLRTRYPIRVQIKQSGGNWVEAVGAGIRLTGDNVVWIDGIAESRNGFEDCIYIGDLMAVGDENSFAKSELRINCAMPMDHKVFGFYKTDASVFAKALRDNIGGQPPMLHIDSPEGYREYHQVASRPTAALTYLAGDDGSETTITAEAGLTRIVPPVSERAHAERAAERRLASSRHPRRASAWVMPGIRTEYKAGAWIGAVKMIDSNHTDDTDYRIDASIATVRHDFLAQTTTLGGLESELTYARQ